MGKMPYVIAHVRCVDCDWYMKNIDYFGESWHCPQCQNAVSIKVTPLINNSYTKQLEPLNTKDDSEYYKDED